MKKFLLLIIILISAANFYAQGFDKSKARGLFLSMALGPRLPVSDFAEKYSYGLGINFELSYTDNEYLPLFLYLKAGFDHYAGSQNFYRTSDYSAISVNMIPVGLGAKLFLPPLVEDIIILIPTIELGGSFAFSEISNQFKLDSGKSSFIEDKSNFGFHAGIGVSMFLMEVMAYYNYLPQLQSLSADVKVRIPVFIKL